MTKTKGWNKFKDDVIRTLKYDFSIIFNYFLSLFDLQYSL